MLTVAPLICVSSASEATVTVASITAAALSSVKVSVWLPPLITGASLPALMVTEPVLAAVWGVTPAVSPWASRFLPSLRVTV